MTEETAINPVVVDALASINRIATLPKIAGRILELLDDPNATADDLQKVIAGDPVLSARVLKVVNSSFYGMPAAVSSIKQAVVMLGLSGVKNIALAASLSKLFGGRHSPGDLDPQGPWQHSTGVAAAAKLISGHIGGDGESLFLAGLLHDVGTLIAMQAMRQQFAELIEDRKGLTEDAYTDMERRILGTTHEELGAALCRRWNFPKEIQAAVEFHHRPDATDGELRRVAQIVYVADHLAAESEIGYSCTPADGEIPEAVTNALGLTVEVLSEVRAQLPEAAALAEQLCS